MSHKSRATAIVEPMSSGGSRDLSCGQDQSTTNFIELSALRELVKAFSCLEGTVLDQIKFFQKNKCAPTQNAVHPPKPVRKKTKRHTMLNVASSQNDTIIREDKVIVYLRVVFLKVGEIDTLRDRFAADVLIQARWREPLLDGKLHLQYEDVAWESYWNPKLFVENIYGEQSEVTYYSLSFDANGLATITEKMRIVGTFFEFMELNQFPFDSQDLTVTVSTERSTSQVELIADVFDKSFVNGQTFVDEQEWKLHSNINTWNKVVTSTFSNVQTCHPAFSAACKTSRRPGFFVWNILVVMFLICSMAFGTFAVKLDLPQNRLQLSFILLLTTVSFKFAVNQSLPMISYLTYLDKYILASMGNLCAVCIWHAVVPFINAKQGLSSAQLADTIALVVLGALYIALHVVSILAIVKLAKWDNKEAAEYEFNESLSQVPVKTASSQPGSLNEDTQEATDAYNKERIDHRSSRNMVEVATNQAVMSAWQ